jgi:hypothetical protein
MPDGKSVVRARSLHQLLKVAGVLLARLLLARVVGHSDKLVVAALLAFLALATMCRAALIVAELPELIRLKYTNHPHRGNSG